MVYADAADPAAVADDYAARFPRAAVVPLDAYVTQTLGHVTGALQLASIIAAAFGLAVTALIACLFLTLRLTQDRRSVGVLAALGFDDRAIAGQYVRKTVLTAGVGVVCGVAIATLLGESVVGLLIEGAGFGIARLALTPDPLVAFVAVPVGLLAAMLAGAGVALRPFGRGDRSRWLTS